MNAAVIVETRLISSIAQTIKDHMKYLYGWELIIYYGRNNSHLFNEFDCEKNMIAVNSMWDYNHILTDAYFWKHLSRYERVLIFQNDSKILRPGIEEYMDYSFIGAPLYHIPFPCMNGGFSLRNPKDMLACIREGLMSGSHNEDVLFCHACADLGFKLPDFETARSFSVETIFNLGSFGCHAPEKRLNKDQLKQLYNQYENIS